MNSLITVVLLVVAAIIIGLALMSYTISQASIHSSQARLTDFLNQISSNLILYLEHQNESTLWVGINEIVPESVNYYIALFNTSWYPIGISDSYLISDSGASPLIPTNVKVSDVYLSGLGGNFFTPSYKYAFVSMISVAFKDKPLLLKINIEENFVGKAYVVSFIKVGDIYYEVGRLLIEVD